ncbi:AAA family ATPase [Candidatus Pacearchaeota archaeon]|nr:AAA family ATPase [Candidatus Pacearchaeota archaeon]
MILKKLSIKNLRSYESQEMIFPKGSTLLSGDIGSGKTTILLAIEFALFGLQPSQKGTSLLRNGTDTGSVKLEFEIEGTEVIIERTLKRGKKSVNQDCASITIDNEKFEGSVTEVKSKVLKILNYPREFAKKTNLLYKFTVYTPQEEMKQIILEPGDIRLNTLRHVFGIDKYKRIEENTSILVTKLKEKIRINEGIIYDLEAEKKSLIKKKEELDTKKVEQKSAINDYKVSISNRELHEKDIEDLQEKISEKRALETELAKSKILISEKTQQKTTLINTLKSLEMQISEAKKITFSQQEFDSLNQRALFQEQKESEMQKEYITVISKINSLESRRREALILKNKISNMQKCPTCLQEVSSEYKKNIFGITNSEIENIQKQMNELNKNKNELTEKIEDTKRKKSEFKKKQSELELLKVKSENVKEKEERVVDLQKQQDSLQKDLDMLIKHLESTKKAIQDYTKFDRNFEEKNVELKQSKLQENKLAIKKAEVNKELQFVEKEIKEYEIRIKKKEEVKKAIEKIRELEYWVSEKYINLILSTEKQVMLTLKEEFSTLFSEWFSTLVSESLSAKLDDNFSPVIEQQDYELDYAFLSGGERTAIALAYRLSLNQVINSIMSNIKTSNLVILDEPTDGFSAQQLDKIRDVLHQLKADQLILVSHEQKIEGFVDNIIRIRKDFGITNIEQ